MRAASSNAAHINVCAQTNRVFAPKNFASARTCCAPSVAKPAARRLLVKAFIDVKSSERLTVLPDWQARRLRLQFPSMSSSSFVERMPRAARAANDSCGAFSPEGHRCSLADGHRVDHEMHVAMREWRFINKDDAPVVGLPVGLVATDRLSGPHSVVVARWPAAIQRRGDSRRVYRLRRRP